MGGFFDTEVRLDYNFAVNDDITSPKKEIPLWEVRREELMIPSIIIFGYGV